MKRIRNPRLWVGLRPSKARLESAKLMLFFGKTYNEHENYELSEAIQILQHPRYDPSKKTVIYFHGYIESPEVESVHVIVDAYLKRGDHNIIILDWTELADGNYLLEAVPNCRRLGVALGKAMYKLIESGLDNEKLHIVGHSLGGQLAGYAGRTVIDVSKNKTKLKRISALDPAFPPFYPGVFVTHLSDKDAEFVDVIHTDAWLYGAPVSTGTVDFWPNKGKTLQPGCPKRNYKPLTDNASQNRLLGLATNLHRMQKLSSHRFQQNSSKDLCSHRRSWWFWAESVESKDIACFHSVKCKSWVDFKDDKYDKEAPIVQMGIECSADAKGDYYLQTNGEQPYSKGISGIKYE